MIVGTPPSQTPRTRLGEAVSRLARAHPGKSGVFALRDGQDAFAARALLAEAADRTLDVQYYIWRHDLSGTLLLAALRRAADRGVRVRLLLDDNNTSGLDAVLASLDAHPNVEVWLFNPFRNRRFRAWGFLTDFSRLNRRMHNKSFTADGEVTIIGGRNVGDEYFGAGQGVLFVDVDVLAAGPVAAEVSGDFERYWASGSSVPAARVLPRATPGAIRDLSQVPSATERRAMEYVGAVARAPFVRDLFAGRLPLEWATVTMLSDDPAKGLARAPYRAYLWPRLEPMVRPSRELRLVSAYFVPTAEGVKFLVAQARRGVKIAILTNALEATDVAVVHAGYAKWRKPLLRAGVELWEIRRSSAGPRIKDRPVTGSSGSSLHAKTLSVDGSRLFVGSFNFDPRSARLNTELGFVIDSPRLARAGAEAFAARVAAHAYQVRLSRAGRLQWVEEAEGKTRVHRREPGAGVWLRLAVWGLSKLPIEWLL
ncbi:MAG TPA: phospholipase D family protein [Myxococcales bacterium]|nr:phospholipase D family protein [Myxococcales bacterium]